MPPPAFGKQPMKSGSLKSGWTLVEILVVIAIIIILISVMAGVAKRIDDQGKERLCRSTLTLIDNALEQFRDFGYEYKSADFAGLVFPLDCNDYPVQRDVLIPTLRKALGATTVTIEPNDLARPITHQYEYSGSEALYFFLSQVPDCRVTIDKIDKSLLTNKDNVGNEMKLVIDGVSYPLIRIIDPWGSTLRYDYYYDDTLFPLKPELATRKTFPVITSAGPDKQFGTGDDVSSREPK
jgi:type II secretory pathway pseudopilin PulG